MLPRPVGPIQQSFELKRGGVLTLHPRKNAEDMLRRWKTQLYDDIRPSDEAHETSPPAPTASDPSEASETTAKPKPIPKAIVVPLARTLRALGPLASPIAARARKAADMPSLRKRVPTPPTAPATVTATPPPPQYAYHGEPINADHIEDLLQRVEEDRLSPLTLPESTEAQTPARTITHAQYPYMNADSPGRTIFETLVYLSRTPSANNSPAMESTAPPPLLPRRITNLPSSRAVRTSATRMLSFDLDKEIERRRLHMDHRPQTTDDNDSEDEQRASKRCRNVASASSGGHQTPPRSLFELLQETSECH